MTLSTMAKVYHNLPASAKFKVMPSSFFDWYFAIGIPSYINRRLTSITSTIRFFNFLGLLKTLFSPYRRLTVAKNDEKFNIQGAFDQLVFNAISRLVGTGVRLTLIIVGAFGLIIYSLFTILYSLFWLVIPVFSYPAYLNYKSNNFFQSDLESAAALGKKLTSTPLFKQVASFFDAEFVKIFTSPQVDLVQISGKTPQDVIEMIAPTVKPYLDQRSIKPEMFETLVTSCQSFLSTKPQATVIPLGQTLSFGYTKSLEKFSSSVEGKNLALTENEKQVIDQVEKTLTKPQNNNVLLVGEPGVGRHTVIANLASAINSGQLSTLAGKQVTLLETVAISGTGKNLVEVKSNIETVLSEARRAGSIILVIDQIDRICTSHDDRIDLSEVLTTILKDGSLPIIGVTTTADFAKYIRPNTTILKLFEKIDLAEANADETLGILIGKVLSMPKKDKVKITLDALVDIVDRSTKLMPDRRQPQKAILVLEETIAEAKNQKVDVTVALVDEIISAKTKTPIGLITQKESTVLKNLEAILHKRIIGQDEAIIQIAKSMRRARVEIESGLRPIGSFLFLGPTGVGKTETAKALAEAYFGKDDQMVRFDMSEYQGTDALARLIGDAAKDSPGTLATQIRDRPYGILLLDEFEKANSEVHNLFLQVLDEGFLTDAFGKRVSFDNIIVIATSNAGSEFIREQVGSGVEPLKDLSGKLVDHVLQKGLFSPELVNRFDAVVVYKPLTQAEVVKVAELMLINLSKKLKESKNIVLEITQELAQKIAQKAYDPTFGARPIRRLIQDKIEDEIAKMIIDESVKNGDKIAAGNLLNFLS